MISHEFLNENMSEITLLTEDLHTSGIEVLAKQLKRVVHDGEAQRLKNIAESLQISGMTKGQIEFEAAKALRELRKGNDRYLRKSRKEIRELFEKAGIETLNSDNEVYRAAGLPPVVLSAYMRNILRVAENSLVRNIKRMTGTAAAATSERFERILNNAYMQVVTGQKVYTQVLSESCSELVREGVKAFDYQSGRAISVEAAVLMNIRTAVGQTAAEISIAGMVERGITHVETTAHQGARTHKDGDFKDHSKWQGRIFLFDVPENKANIANARKSGTLWGNYQSFLKSTGYGNVAGLAGANCAHHFRPFIIGITEPLYTPEYLQEINNKTVTVPDFVNGGTRERPIYEATQDVRRMERGIRTLKREIASKEAAGLTNEIKPLKARWTALQKRLRTYISTANEAVGETVLRSYSWRTKISE